ncbi:MAG: sodium:proton antiporter [Acidobacteria bacterium]|nr:sodium:proton antiporter [Acidobacteriota bacterium]
MNGAGSPTVPLTPLWAVFPFVGYLLLIAILPLFAARLWESNRNKLLLALAAGVPAIVHLAGLPA